MTQLSRFPVSIIMEQRPASSPWADNYWSAVGLIVGAANSEEPQLINEQGSTKQFLLPGYQVKLYVDECESYYHNMMSPKPSCYIIAHQHDDQPPKPFLVSMSFDEAHAYLEGDELVYSVEIPAELYRWTESFELENYFPEKKRKRKLNNWKQDGSNIRT